MSGRPVILAMAAFAIVASVFFYRTLKQSPEYKNLATEQMKMEFIDYSITIKKVENLKVAEEGSTQFFVGIKDNWNFLIHDKTLRVTAPEMKSQPAGKVPSPEMLELARKNVHDFIFSWLADKYHTSKDINVEVRFPSEP